MLWTVFMIRFIIIQRKAFYGPGINGNPNVYIDDRAFEILARAVRHVIRTRGNSRLNKIKPSSHRRSYWKTSRPVMPRIYHRYLEPAIFVGKDSVRQKDSFKTHHMIDDVLIKQMMLVRVKFVQNVLSPAKSHTHTKAISYQQACLYLWTGHCTFVTGGWGWQWILPPRSRGDMATWTAIPLDSIFNLLLLSSILLVKYQDCYHFVIIGTLPGCVYVVDIISSLCCLAVGVRTHNTLQIT